MSAAGGPVGGLELCAICADGLLLQVWLRTRHISGTPIMEHSYHYAHKMAGRVSEHASSFQLAAIKRAGIKSLRDNGAIITPFPLCLFIVGTKDWRYHGCLGHLLHPHFSPCSSPSPPPSRPRQHRGTFQNRRCVHEHGKRRS